MRITRIAFWAMLVVAAIESYEMLRDQRVRPEGLFMLTASLIAALWLFFGSPRDSHSE